MLYLKNDKQASLSTFTITLCGIKFFYQHTLRREWTTPESTQGSSWCAPTANSPYPSCSAWRKCSASWAASVSHTTASAWARSTRAVCVCKNGWPRWVVHCQTAGDGLNALKYLASYIFRVAISNRRILKVEDGRVPIRVQRRLTRHRLSHHRSPSSAALPVATPGARAPSLILKEVNRREQRRCTQTGSPPRGRGRRFPAPALAPAWLPKSGLRQTVTPATEPPGLASDPPPSRSPRAGWRFTCADGLPPAQSAARSPKRCFALIPKWE